MVKAGGGEPDIVFRPPESADFQVVCEVSANKGLTDPQFREQLDSALRHAVNEHEEAGVSVTYVFLARNLREPGSDEHVRKVYRDFLKQHPKALRLWGPIRFVLMEAAEFATGAEAVVLRRGPVVSARPVGRDSRRPS